MNIKDLMSECRLKHEKTIFYNEELKVEVANYVYKETVVSKYIFACLDYNSYKKYISDKEEYENVERKIIEPIFFDLMGDLGWNLYFVCVLQDDEYERILPDEFIEFEKNEKYARKVVISEENFKKFIPIGKVIVGNKTKEIIDPINEWNNTLVNYGLDFCLDTYSKQKINNFLDGKNIHRDTDSDDFNSNNEKQKYNFKNIKKLCLTKNFRPHCFGIETQIHFGNVNLFTGANGSGKTSILEAIELAVTGGIRKNSTGNIENDIYNSDLASGISLVLQDDTIVDIPTNAKIRKERESQLYQNRKGNRERDKLNKAFHQYNYYSFEDTFSFCFLGEQPNYNEEFSKVIYGEGTKIIEQNFLKYCNKFEETQNSITSDIDCLTREIGLLEKNDISYSDINIHPIYTLLESIKLTYENIEDKTNFEKVAEWLARQNSRLTKIKVLLDAYLIDSDELDSKGEVLNVIDKCILDKGCLDKMILEVEERIISISNRVNSLLIEYEIDNYEFIEYEKTFNEIERRINVYNRVVIEIKDINKSNLLLELYGKKEELQLKIDVLNYFKDTWKNILNKELTEKTSEELDVSIFLKYKNLEESNEKLKDISEKISLEEAKNNDINNIILKVKSLGLQYINETIDNAHCPLCGNDFKTKDKFIEAVDNEIGIDTSYYKSLLDEKKMLSNNKEEIIREIDSLRMQKQDIQNLYNAIDYMEQNDLLGYEVSRENISHNKMKDLVNKTILFLEDKLQELKKIIYEISSLESVGYDFNVIQNAIDYINELAGNENDILDIKVIQSIENNLKDNLKEIMLKKRGAEIKRDDKKLSIEKEKAKIEEEAKIKQSYLKKLELLNEKTRKTNALSNFIESIEENGILIDNGDSITKVRNVIQGILDEILKITDTVNKAVKQKNNIEQLNRLNEQIALKERMIQRCQLAMDVLNNLKTSAQYSEEFIKDNINDISDLFINLHFPREFDKLDLNKEGQIVGYRRIANENIEVPIYLMSTGQRIAVVISIFFKLYNSVSTAPQIILLDEPVSNIDDLNILGLLDFLREMVITTGSQIFFTTANYSVAKLFKRKFSFLRDKFNEFKFTRYGNTKSKVVLRTFNEFENEWSKEEKLIN